MFAAPPVIETSVFVRIPENLHRDRPSHWIDYNQMGQKFPTFLEGPSFDRAGNLWVTDIPWGRLFKIAPDGSITVALEYDGEPNGLKFHKDGRAFITDHKNGIMVFDPKTGKIAPYRDRGIVERFKGVNDLVFASNGDIYFTDQGQTGQQDRTGRLYRLRCNGALDLILDCIPSPNGLVLNKAQNIVYLCVTRDNAIWRVPLLPDGSATKVGIFIQMTAGTGPDGMAIDEEENIVVCHVGLGTVWVFSALGEPLYRIKSSAGLLTTNCAFGGPDNKTLFITESKTGTVLKAELKTPGRRMYSHM